MARRLSLLRSLAIASLLGCGGATTAARSAPDAAAENASDAGAENAPDDASPPEDAATLVDAPLTVDAAIFPEPGTSTACALAVSGTGGKSFQSSAARIYIGGTEVPFPHFECGDPATGDPYYVLVTMSGYDDGTAGDGTADVGLYASDAWNAMGVGGGTCAIALTIDGVPASVDQLMAADAGSTVTAALGDCALATAATVSVTSGWVRAALDATP
jgi:hypothetical protein